jgi:hypothetical protein
MSKRCLVLRANGAEAVLRSGSSALKPKVIILDLWMPYMDGLEFRAMQQSLPSMADIPVMLGAAAIGAFGLGAIAVPDASVVAGTTIAMAAGVPTFVLGQFPGDLQSSDRQCNAATDRRRVVSRDPAGAA